MEFSRQDYWSGLPFATSGDLPDAGIEPGSPILEEDALTSEPPGKLDKKDLHDPDNQDGVITHLEPVLISDNFQVKMSLLPLFAKNLRIDTIQLENAEITLKVEKDGSFTIVKYLPKGEQTGKIINKHKLQDFLSG